MIGPFKKVFGGYDHILVATDKFTKQMEVKPIKMLMAAKAAEFKVKIANSWELEDFCDEQNIKVCHASITHQGANSQVERANGVVLQGIKSKIFDWLKKYATK
nr:uncharacterized protein LOC117854733 [Setaria viridis]